MADSTQPPSRAGRRRAARGPAAVAAHRSAAAIPGAAQAPRGTGAGLLALLAAAAGSVLLGLAAGAAWLALAPRVTFIVVGHGSANVLNPETTAFIAADGWFCAVGVAGGLVTGALGWAFAVRRYGPLPMAGLLAGGAAAAYAALWVGQHAGLAAFNARLAAARTGALLRAPLVLGAHGAVAFWPLAAGVVAGGLEGIALLRERRALMAAQVAAYGPAGPAYPAGPGHPPAAQQRPAWAAPGEQDPGSPYPPGPQYPPAGFQYPPAGSTGPPGPPYPPAGPQYPPR